MGIEGIYGFIARPYDAYREKLPFQAWDDRVRLRTLPRKVTNKTVLYACIIIGILPPDRFKGDKNK